LTLEGNPARRIPEVVVEWPDAAGGELDVFDVEGRLVQRVRQSSGARGVAHLSLDPRGLRDGLYFVRVRAGGAAMARRLAVLERARPSSAPGRRARLQTARGPRTDVTWLAFMASRTPRSRSW